MKRLFFIAAVAFILFTIESTLSQFLGRWFKPNLLILLVVFLNMHRGIRYALVAAFLSGLLKDSFSTGTFGIYTFSFVFCAYAMVLARRYFFDSEFIYSKILITFAVIALNTLVVYALQSYFCFIDSQEAFIFIILPEVTLTILVAHFVLEKLKRCALKFSA